MKNKPEKINQLKKCQEKRYDNSPCNRPLYDDKHCIFHSEEIEKKKDDFDKAFWIEFERQKKEDKCYDFSRFIFPDSISFKGLEFDKDVYFDCAQFAGNKNSFSEAKFTGNNTSFEATQFNGKVTSFLGAQFTGNWTSFSEAKFTGNKTDFRWGTFTGKVTDFSDAEFTGNKTDFSMAEFTGEEINFSGAKFTSNVTCFSEAEFTGKVTYFSVTEFAGKDTDFSRAKFKGEETYFSEAKFTSNETDFSLAEFTGNETYFSLAEFIGYVILYHAIFKNVWYLFESLTKRKWLFLKKYLIKDWRFYLQEETANRHPLIKRLVNDALYLEEFKLRHPIVYFLWKISSDCGRSFIRWLALSFGIALIFGFIFMYIGPEAFELSHVPTKFSFFYYSIVTFTTLGFGDITPKTLSTEILVTIEVILGYIMLGGLISIFANKLARRS